MAKDPEDHRSRLSDWDRRHVWHAFSQMADYQGLIIESAQGCWLTDINGRRYLDAASNLWCNVHGHRHPKIDRAIRDQLDQVAHVSLLGMSHPVVIQLAKELVEIAPHGLDHVFFSSDGSSAIEVALKMAFQYWRQCDSPDSNRTTYLALGQSYHGDTLGSVSVGGVMRFHAMFNPLLFPVLRGPCPDLYRLPEGVESDDACRYYLRQYRSIFEQHSHRLAAMILEPIVQGAAGMVVHPVGFLKGISDLCREFDVLLIADEIAVGMGRTGTMFGCEQEGVCPDLMCLGKGLSGGYLPFAATMANERIWQAFLGDYAESKSFFHGHTYGGNALGAAAARATLQIFQDDDTLGQLPAKAEGLRRGLDRLASHGLIGDVRQRGLMAALELVEDKRTKSPFLWSERMGGKLCELAIQRGVWLRPIGNVIPIIPPLSISLPEIDTLCDVLAESLEEV